MERSDALRERAIYRLYLNPRRHVSHHQLSHACFDSLSSVFLRLLGRWQRLAVWAGSTRFPEKRACLLFFFFFFFFCITVPPLVIDPPLPYPLPRSRNVQETIVTEHGLICRFVLLSSSCPFLFISRFLQIKRIQTFQKRFRLLSRLDVDPPLIRVRGYLARSFHF